MVENLTQQLEALYAEREYLSSRLGVRDAEDVVNMVQSLEAQLRSFYDHPGHPGHPDDADSNATARLLRGIRSLSEHLDQDYRHKSVVFEIVDDKPVLKAVWTEQRTEGDQ